nr:hypothetical protein [Tanacetum cinerariifolium]
MICDLTHITYPTVQENLKLSTKDQVILEDPTSSTGTLSSLQNLDKELSFTNQFFLEKPHEEEPEKTNTESEAPLSTSIAKTIAVTTTTILPPPLPQPQQSIVDPTLLQRIGELEQHMANLIQDNLALEERLDKHGYRLYNLENLNIPYQVSKAVDEIITDAVDWVMQASLRARFSDMHAVDMKEILQQWMFEDKSCKAHEDHKNLFDALQKSLERDYSNQLLSDLEATREKKRKKRDLPRTPSGSPPLQPPPPPPPAGAFGTPGSRALSSSKTAPSTPQSMAWTTSDTRYESTGVSATQESSPIDSLINDDSILDEQVQLFDDEDIRNDQLPKADMRKDCPALSISKMKVARYPNFGLKLLVISILTDMILRQVKKKSEHTCGFSVSSASKSTQYTESSPIDSLINDDSILDEHVQLFDDEDIGNDQLPKADMRKDW